MSVKNSPVVEVVVQGVVVVIKQSFCLRSLKIFSSCEVFEQYFRLIAIGLLQCSSAPNSSMHDKLVLSSSNSS